MEQLYRTSLLIEATGPTRLAIFDMDGTLLRTPEPSWGVAKYKELTGKLWPYEGWWSKPESLLPPFEAPLIQSTYREYKAAKRAPGTKVIVMTGRMGTPALKRAVQTVLRNAGIRHTFGDDLFLKPPGSSNTASYKLNTLEKLAKRYPTVTTLDMWDDRADHVGDFQAKIRSLGLKGKVTHVTGTGFGSSKAWDK